MKKILVGVFTVLLLASGAQADPVTMTYGFDAITSNNSANVLTAENQLSVVVGVENDNISFTFTNAGPNPSIICDIYFYDGVILNTVAPTLTPTGIVTLQANLNPGDLPGLSSTKAPTYSLTLEDDVSIQGSKGIDPGESLTVTFKLLPDAKKESDQATLDYIAEQLAMGHNAAFAALAGTSSDPNYDGFLIGIHVQGLGVSGGGSESLVNNNPAPIPEPCTLALVSIGGLLGLGGLKLRRKQS